MEDFKKNQERDKDIVFSKSVKAGKRIYYVDVKKNRKGELFIALTESKKVISGDTESPSINFEKHKIFLCDFDSSHFPISFSSDFVSFGAVKYSIRELVIVLDSEKNYNTIKQETQTGQSSSCILASS